MIKKQPKICFVHGKLGLGGAEVLRLSILKEMVHRQHDVEVIQLRGEGELTQNVEALGVKITSLDNKGGLFDRAGVRRLKALLKAKNYDVVQSSQFVTNLHTGFACRSLGIANHIIEEHGIYLWKKLHHRLLDRIFNSRAAAVIACSRKVAESAAENLNLPTNKIDVIHNCVGDEHLLPINQNWKSSEAWRAQRAKFVGTDGPVHLTGIVGTLRWEKGHRFLLEAWQQLRKQEQLTAKHHLLIIGDGPLRSELETQANDLPNVHFLGSVSKTRTVLRCLDLFVLPSVNEGFGIAIIEAMAAGVPVISTRSGGIPEVVTDGTGILVPPENSSDLATAIADTINRDCSATLVAARQRVEDHFTPTAYVDRLESIYARLLNF